MRGRWPGLILVLTLGGCGQPSTPSSDGLLHIDEVVVHVGGSSPVLVSAQVVGYLPDGCTDVFHWGELMAASVITTVPVVALYVFIHRWMVEGLVAGSVKG